MNKGLDCFALTITIIGAINWGLIGFFSFDLVAWLFASVFRSQIQISVICFSLSSKSGFFA